jgi:hypothetical protein
MTTTTVAEAVGARPVPPEAMALPVATAAAVEEEEEEGAADSDGDRAADGNGGPVTHNDRKDGDGSAAPCSGRMTTTTTAMLSFEIDWY